MAMCLPKVFPPLPWTDRRSESRVWQEVPSLSDFSGGYLSKAGFDFMHNFRLLTSHDYEHFYASFNDYDSYKCICQVITSMKNVLFKINTVMLSFIKDNQLEFKEAGLLMPSFLDKVDPAYVREEIRYLLSTEKYKDSIFSFRGKRMDKRIQQARYEQFLIRLAEGYKDFDIDFPAFID